MKRTNRIIEACQAQGVELPSEWFARDDGRMCASCAEVWYPKDKHIFACSCDGTSVEVPRGSYIGPDLTLPENLHEALRLADALSRYGADLFSDFDGDSLAGNDLIHRATVYRDNENAKVHDKVDIFHGFAPTRIEAVNRAIEKALGLPEWEEPTP